MPDELDEEPPEPDEPLSLEPEEPLSPEPEEPLSLEELSFLEPLSPELLSLFDSDLVSAAPDFFGALPYRSAYQPPPFKMKPAPPEI